MIYTLDQLLLRYYSQIDEPNNYLGLFFIFYFWKIITNFYFKDYLCRNLLPSSLIERRCLLHKQED